MTDNVPQGYDKVLEAVGAREGPHRDGSVGCSSEQIAEATGLGSEVVAAVLEDMWADGVIEGIPTAGTTRPHLRGVVLVFPDRPRRWGADGAFRPRP